MKNMNQINGSHLGVWFVMILFVGFLFDFSIFFCPHLIKDDENEYVTRKVHNLNASFCDL